MIYRDDAQATYRDVGSYEHCDPHGRGEIEQRRSTTPGTKHMEVQVSREGRKPVGTGGGRVMHGAITELPRTPGATGGNTSGL